METNKLSKVLSTGIISAIAASLCCITPVLVLIVGGSSGIASTFSWLEPARPYLIGITVLVIGFAWHQKLKSKKVETDCDCEEDKPSFMQSKTFLGIVTVCSALILAFPYYSNIFYPKTKAKAIGIESSNLTEVEFDIEGMTCKNCFEPIKYAVAQLPGYRDASANYETGKVAVQFDKTKTDMNEIISAINETGYKTIASEIKK